MKIAAQNAFTNLSISLSSFFFSFSHTYDANGFKVKLRISPNKLDLKKKFYELLNFVLF